MSSAADADARPQPLHMSKSFSRFDPNPGPRPGSRGRASTVQGTAGPIPEIMYQSNAALVDDAGDGGAEKADIFAPRRNKDGGSSADHPAVGGENHPQLPESFDDLPIEIRSQTERFLESLSAKVHPSPLSIEALAEMFQDFYARAESHIATHIATLSARIGRDKSPSPSVASRTSTGSKTSGAGSGAKRTTSQDDVTGGEMLTASEIQGRRRARKLLELKKVALEEAVERAVCEKVYDRVWRHRSTDDEERDSKLRSRTAALSVVGIGLKELLVSADDVTEAARQSTVEKQDEVKEWLSGARENIHKMDDVKYPLGKLQHLTAAHKSIVETLSQLFPASSSADEILPTLIYTLITSAPEDINVISNLHFIQRFRASSKVDGEAAYCLVNLEAAISFLETVDLSSLRADEVPSDTSSSAPNKTTPSSPAKPVLSTSSTMPTTLSPPSKDALTATDPLLNPPPTPNSTGDAPRSPRRLSNLIASQTNRLEAASESVRASVLDSADQAIHSINSTVENSLAFVFGRLREQQQQQQHVLKDTPTSAAAGAAGTAANGTPNGPTTSVVVVPKTLEDARRLVSAPLRGTEAAAQQAVQHDDADASSVRSGVSEHSARGSSLSGLSARKVLFGGTEGSGEGAGGDAGAAAAAPAGDVSGAATAGTVPPAGAVESMRSFGNSLNPLKGFPGMGMLPRFGRGGEAASPPPPAAAAAADGVAAGENGTAAQEGRSQEQLPQVSPQQSKAEKERTAKGARATKAIEELRKTAPPVKRFVEMKDAKEVRVGEVEELLREYQRLAEALRRTIREG
ncbi:hypothetical protein BDY21DRAFT_320384 [Lineolata rhizophorae]|uniref:VPS9 domain-containing protein n=1 Tax=Lineolata rhizophorae TaxID=578093 RepID=A0A6A6P2M5_9PEZI|nr:hypothetical protein BDY21DRAFT_320384 [Lineolata rhizophorae]